MTDKAYSKDLLDDISNYLGSIENIDKKKACACLENIRNDGLNHSPLYERQVLRSLMGIREETSTPKEKEIPTVSNFTNKPQNKEIKMTENLNRPMANDLRVIVYGEPNIATITPKSGENAGKQIDVLNINVYKPNASKQPDGSWKQMDSDWYKLQLFSEHAKEISPLIKDGLALRVSGLIKENTFQGKDGQTKTSKNIVVNNIAVDLLQRGIKGIDFEKKNREQQVNKKEPSMEL